VSQTVYKESYFRLDHTIKWKHDHAKRLIYCSASNVYLRGALKYKRDSISYNPIFHKNPKDTNGNQITFRIQTSGGNSNSESILRDLQT